MNRALWSRAAAAAMVLAGCSNGGDGADPAPTQSPTTTVTTAPATDAPPPTEAPDSGGQTYRIRKGDTLSAIADRFDTTVRELTRLNDIDDPHTIRAGRRIKIPGDSDQ